MRMFMTQLILFFFCCCWFSGRESYYVAQTILVLVILQSQLPEHWHHGLLCQSDFTFRFFFYLLLLRYCCCFCFCFICECIGGGCLPLCMCGDQRTTSPLPPHGFCDQTQVFSLGSKCLYRLSHLPSYPWPRMHLNVHFQKKTLRVREILSF